MKLRIAAFAGISVLWLLAACSSGTSSSSSGSNSGGSSIVPPVQAQTIYSNSSISGTYSASWWVFNGMPTASYYGALGTLKFDGAGNVSSGTISAYNTDPTSPCKFNVTGTYSIDSTAVGTASLTLSPIAPSRCTSTDTWKLAIAAADGGAAIQMARTDQIGNGSANRQ